MPQSHLHGHHKISNSKPRLCEGAYEAPPSRHSKHTPKTTPSTANILPTLLEPPQLTAPVLLLFQNAAPYPGPTYGAQIGHYSINNALEESNPCNELDLPSPVNIIANNDSSTEGNIFCFGAFADKHTGTVYIDLTGTFPFMFLEWKDCFLVVYHYKTNAISGLPIANMEEDTIILMYKK